MGKAQHTPTPWEVWRAPEGGAVAVRAVYHDEMGCRNVCWPALCNAGGQSNEANAALIVAAVNSHAALTAALEEARGALEPFVAAHDRYEKATRDHERMWAGASFADFNRARTALATIKAALGRVEG